MKAFRDHHWVSLSDAIYLLIREVYADAEADSMIILLKDRSSASCFYDSDQHISVKYRENSDLYLRALGAEETAQIELIKRLKSARVRGRAADASGSRRDLSEEDWQTCHINIARNELLAPLSEHNFKPLNGVRISSQDLLRVVSTSAFKRKSAAGVSACLKWLVGLRRSDDDPPTKEELGLEAARRFNIGASQFRQAYETANIEAPNERWGRGGRPRKNHEGKNHAAT